MINSKKQCPSDMISGHEGQSDAARIKILVCMLTTPAGFSLVTVAVGHAESRSWQSVAKAAAQFRFVSSGLLGTFADIQGIL